MTVTPLTALTEQREGKSVPETCAIKSHCILSWFKSCTQCSYPTTSSTVDGDTHTPTKHIHHICDIPMTRTKAQCPYFQSNAGWIIKYAFKFSSLQSTTHSFVHTFLWFPLILPRRLIKITFHVFPTKGFSSSIDDRLMR